MKEQIYTDIICKGFCKYYKKGKKDIYCGGYELLRKNLTPNELRAIAALSNAESDIKNQIPPKNKKLERFVCRRCEFLADGCDFADNRSGPPCGGYNILRKLKDSCP
jgi:hypothetical protein